MNVQTKTDSDGGGFKAQVPAAELAGYLLRFWNCLRGTARRFHAVVDEVGLTQMGTKTLQALLDRGGCIPSDLLPDLIGLDVPSASQVLVELRRAGYLHLSRETVALSGAGAELAERLSRVRLEGLVEYVETLSADQHRALVVVAGASPSGESLSDTSAALDNAAVQIFRFWSDIRFGSALKVQTLSEELGVSMGAVRILRSLCNKPGGLSTTVLTEHLGMAKGSAGRFLDEMCSRGWVESFTQHVAITSLGRDVLEQLDNARLAGLMEYCASIEDEQRRRLRAALKLLLD